VFINNYRRVEYEDLLLLLDFSHASQRTSLKNAYVEM
jgi:hypothetical protein